jgi:hypothetical protein
MNLNKPYNRTEFISFLERSFLPDDLLLVEEKLSIDDFKTQFCKDAYKLGSSKSMGLDVYEITHTSTHDARVGISKDAFQILLRKSYNNRALVLFVPEGSKQYRFSLIQIEAELNDLTSRIKRSYSNPRRYSFLLGEGAHIKTPNQFLLEKGKLKPKDGDYFPDLSDRFSVEVLTKDFYRELSNWYFWAIKNVRFPNDINDDNDDDMFNSENVIRLITRLIFVWFLKQKELVANDLFDKNALKAILKDFTPESDKQTNYYRAILQNLFFATLNQEIGKRAFAPDKGYLENRSNSGIKNLYRYESEFQGDTTQVMSLFSQIPFLNGGLFECLDGKEKDGKTYYWDGFSRSAKRQAHISNRLFFAGEQMVDLSKEYNDTKMKAVKVSGIIEILSKYNFTVEENTPVEIQVALDPELLGKVFENLLGAFNPETKETARKQTGSFYTPREIVSYMVNESLIAYYRTKVPEVQEESLRNLFSYEDKPCELQQADKEKLVQATFDAKILDPACGSGAFPMGILQQMVHVLKKLDPDNTQWNNVVLAQAESEFDKAEKLNDEDKTDLVAEIESTFHKGLNYPDYARKLHLIENCIYGVDIQSIAVQISKLRFFISLICEQRRSENADDNFGIRPLPNLETKFVAANTLIGIEKNEEDMEYFKDDHIKKLIDRLKHIRHRQFMVTNASKKKELRRKDEELRLEIVNEVKRLYVEHADEHLSRYRMQLKVAELELAAIEKAPDDIRTTTISDLFGNETTSTYNYSANRKKELKAQIKLLNNKITMGSDYSRLNAVVNLAKQLTSWNPYDQNKHSDFFDPEWMFGFKEGFDVVIGNPPYIKEYTDKSAFDGIRESEYYQGKMDLWYIFACYGIDLLKDSGHLCYIATNNWVTNAGASKMRNKVILDSKIIQLVDFGNLMIFESASIQTMVMIFEKNKTIDNYCFDYRKLAGNTTKNDSIDLLFRRENSKATYLNPIVKRKEIVNSLLTFNNNSDDFILDKIKSKGDYELNERNEVAQGIVLPQDTLNRKNKLILGNSYKIGEGIFQLNNLEKSNLKLSKDETKLVKPYFTTEQIHRYYTSHTNSTWLIYTDSSFKKPESMNYYPNLKQHLDKYAKVITSDNKPYGLHRAREERFFKGEKIIVQRKCVGHPSFSYADFDTYVSATFYVIKSNSINHKYLLGLLNSKLIEFWLKKKGKMQGDNFQLDKEPLLDIPIHKPTEKEQSVIIDYIDKILVAKKGDIETNTTALEHQIDELVYKLYDLTYAEVQVVEDGKFWLSEEEYEKIDI